MANKAVAVGPKYVILRNMGPSTEVICPDSRDRAGEDLLIAPYDAITVRASDYQKWEDDVNMASVLESGRVVMTRSDVRAKGIPRMPDTSITDPFHKSIVAELVYGDDQRFRDVLSVDLEKNARVEQRDFMSDTYPTLLSAAREWLRKWGPPDNLKWREEAITEKLDAIREARRNA